MKALKFLFCTLLLSYTLAVRAQSSKASKWICGKGFWVIKSNIHTPKNATIFFYNNDRTLVYKEEITGKRINPDRMKTLRRLESVLNQSVTAWQKEGIVKENLQLVASKQ